MVCLTEPGEESSVGFPVELGSAQTRSWRTASNGFAELCKAIQSPAKPLEAVRHDRFWTEPSSRANPLESPLDWSNIQIVEVMGSVGGSSLRSQNVICPTVASACIPASISYVRIFSVVGDAVDQSAWPRSPRALSKSMADTMEAHPSGGVRYASTVSDPSVASGSTRAAQAHMPRRRRRSVRMVAAVGIGQPVYTSA